MHRIYRVVGMAVVFFLPGAMTWAQPGSEGATVSVNGIEMYYEVHGTGTPLVLLHGFNNSSAMWLPVLESLSAEYEVILPDLRGHGRSSKLEGEFTHRQSAQDVFALLDHLGVGQFKAMGISTGGMTLLHMATAQPDRVQAMVLIGATSYFPEQARAVMRTINPDTQPEEAWATMRERHVHGDEQIRALWTQFNRFQDSYDDMNFTGPYLSTVTAQTLIVHGDRDVFFPVEISSPPTSR